LYGALAVAFLVAAIVSVVSYLRLARTPARAIISELEPPEKWQFNFAYVGPPALSPDGGTLAFPAVDASGKTMLWVRSLASLTAQPLAGTEGGSSPFWSPDGRSLGFFADGKLKTLAVLGGPAVEVADAPFHRGGGWNREGALLFVPDAAKGLYQVAASGGAPVPVFKLDPSKSFDHRWPKYLPDGKHFLYHAHAVDAASSGTYFASLDGKENRLLVKGSNRATYASGYLLYLLDSTLMAQVFDPERGQLKGDAHPVATGILESERRYCIFDVSENGVLIYLGGYAGGERRITWFDRSGKELSTGDREKGRLDNIRLSPDGAKLAFNAGDPSYDIWVDELARGVRIRLTNEPGTGHNPTWSPDGSRILFSWSDKLRQGIYQINSNGSGGKELLLAKETSGPIVWPADWSPDGRFILFGRGYTPLNPIQVEVWVLPLVGDRKPRLFFQNGYTGQFSPDGRWVAYTSEESGKVQIYVVPFDATKVLNTDPGSATSPSGKWQISTSGGYLARWRRDGKEIFYRGPNNQMMAAEVDGTGNNFEVRKEQVLFRIGPTVINEYDVTPDGNRFVMATQKGNPNAPLTLVQNWTALLANKP
jgi:Tol biopolymer transport system component